MKSKWQNWGTTKSCGGMDFLGYTLSWQLLQTISQPSLPPYTFILILNMSLLNLCKVSSAWGGWSWWSAFFQGESAVRRDPACRQQPRVLSVPWRNWATPPSVLHIHVERVSCLNFSVFCYSGPQTWRGWGWWDRRKLSMLPNFHEEGKLNLA